MKNTKSILILLGVFAILLAGYMVYQKFGDSYEKIESTTDYQTILETDREKLSEVTINYNAQSITLIKKDNDFVLAKPENITADKTVIEDVISTLISLRADKLIFEGEEIVSQFGFENPIASIEIKLSDGTSQVLKIGNMSPSKNGHYVKTLTSKKIYLLSLYDANKLLVDEEKIKDTTQG